MLTHITNIQIFLEYLNVISQTNGLSIFLCLHKLSFAALFIWTIYIYYSKNCTLLKWEFFQKSSTALRMAKLQHKSTIWNDWKIIQCFFFFRRKKINKSDNRGLQLWWRKANDFSSSIVQFEYQLCKQLFQTKICTIVRASRATLMELNLQSHCFVNRKLNLWLASFDENPKQT